MIDKQIIGYGHKSETLDIHSIFKYNIDPLFKSATFEEVKLQGLADDFRLADPTSFWAGHVVVCATQHQWRDEQPVVHAIFKETD